MNQNKLNKKKKEFDLKPFKKLWKTQKNLEQSDKSIWIPIINDYWTKCHKPKGSITRKDLADRVFSEYIRLSNADEHGICTCVTCGARMPWTEIQNGHFISRGNMKYRFSEINCHPQDSKCNVMLNGNYTKYTLYMIDKYGKDKVEEMVNDKTTKEIKQYEYEEMIIERYQFITERKKKQKK